MNTVLTTQADWADRPTPFEWVTLRRGGLACFDALGSLVVVYQGARGE